MKLIPFYSTILCMSLILCACSPLHLSESKESIREQILQATPVGMRLDEVEKVIKQKHMVIRVEYDPKVVELSEIMGVTKTNGIPVQQWPRGALPKGGCIGANLGSSCFWEEALGYWGFDKDKKLIDVFVYKQYNGL